MATEPIVVAISEDGSRVVQGAFDDVAKSARKTGEAVGALQAELDQYVSKATSLSQEVAVLTKQYQALQAETKQYQTQTKQLQTEVDNLSKRLQGQAKAGHEASEGVGESEHSIFSLKREMTREARTVNFFANSLSSIIPASSGAGEAIRLLGAAMVGGMGLGLAIEAALAGFKLLGEYVKESTEKQVKQIEVSVAVAYAFREVSAAAHEMVESLDVKDKGSSWILSQMKSLGDETRRAQQEMATLLQTQHLMDKQAMGANPFSAMYAMGQSKGLETKFRDLEAKFDELTAKQASAAVNYADVVLPAVLESEERDLGKSIKNIVASIDGETMKSKAMTWVNEKTEGINDELEGLNKRAEELRETLAKTPAYRAEATTLDTLVRATEKQISALEERAKRLKDMAAPIAVAQGNQTAHEWEKTEAENTRRVRREVAQTGADEYLAINLRAAGAVEELNAKTDRTLEQMIGASEEAKNRVRSASAKEALAIEAKRQADQSALARKGGFLGDLLAEVEPASAAVRKVAAAQELLNKAVSYGLITDAERVRILTLVDQKYKDQIYPLGQITRELEQETNLLHLNENQRQVQTKLLADEKTLRQQGVTLSEQEERDLQAKIVLYNVGNKIAQEREALLKELTESQTKFLYGQEALNQLLARGSITLQQYNLKLGELRLASGNGTFSDGFIHQLNVMEMSTKRFTSNVGNLFGDMTNGMVDGLAQATGQAVAFGDNFGDALNQVGRQALANLTSGLVKLGLQMLLNYTVGQALGSAAMATTSAQAASMAAAWAPAASLASLASYGSNAAPAMTALTTTTALAESLALAGSVAGYSEGGYTGDLSRTAVAGVVHGREFVVNADATARNRATLEAMNSGSTVPPRTGAVSVSIHNYTQAHIEVQQLSETEIRIIARQEATQAVHREAPRAVATDLADPNGRVSRQLAVSTNAQRKR